MVPASRAIAAKVCLRLCGLIFPEHTVGAGLQQGLSYAEQLDIPFVFSSNGDAYLFHDSTGTFPQREQVLKLEQAT